MKRDTTASPVIVLGLYIPGVALIKQFVRQGIPCLGMDCDLKELGFSLRGRHQRLCPDPDKEPQRWFSCMGEVAAMFARPPVIIVTADKYIPVLEMFQDALQKQFLYAFPQGVSARTLLSKRGAYDIVNAAGVPQPETFFVHTVQELDEVKGKIAYPAIIKPEFSHTWRVPQMQPLVKSKTVIEVNSQRELKEWYEKVSVFDARIIVQGIVPGPDPHLYYHVSYVDRQQRCLGYFIGNKKRITPIHFGHGSYVEVAHDPETNKIIHDLSMKLLGHCRYWGVSGIEFKFDERERTFKLIEINPRYGLWDGLGIRVGVDVATLYYRDIRGENIEPRPAVRNKAKWVSFSNDISAFLEYRRENAISLWGWLRSLLDVRHTVYSDVFWDEPKLLFSWSIKRILKKLFKRKQYG
jgi:D-aspartate ligase